MALGDTTSGGQSPVVAPYVEAPAYWRAGFVNPIPVRGKTPPVEGYTGKDGLNVSWADLQTWTKDEHAFHNIAIRHAGTVGIDVDGPDGADSLAKAEEELGQLPPTWSVTSRGPDQPRRTYFYRVPGLVDMSKSEGRFRKQFGPLVDIIHRGHRYSIVWPSIHPETGQVYRWYDQNSGAECAIPSLAQLPELPESWVEYFRAHDVAPETDPAQAFDVGRLQRNFTRSEAVAYVKTYGLDPLAAAPNGDINNKLRDAALIGAHFDTGDFWSRSTYEKQIYRALDKTAYDGKTWTAQPTIDQAYRDNAAKHTTDPATYWLATLVTPEVAAVNEHERAVERALAGLRASAEAKELFAAEQHAKLWKPPVSVGSLADELLLPAPEQQWRIKGFLPAGGNAVLAATRKSGKTTITINLIKSLVDHEPFLGRFDCAVPDGTVAAFNYEVGADQYRQWLREASIINTAQVFLLHLRGERLPIADPNVRAWIVRWLRDRNVRVWILDPYARAALGIVTNENDNAMAGVFLDHLDVIKSEAGVTEIVLPAHTGKGRAEAGEESARGAQRLEDWPDALWYLTKDTDTGGRFLRAEGRDVDHPEERLDYDQTTRRLRLGGWDRRTTKLINEAQKVVDFITDHPGRTQNDIKDEFKIGSDKARALVYAARDRIYTQRGPGNSLLHYAK